MEHLFGDNGYMDCDAGSFWKNVKALIKEERITQETLCSLCNFSVSTFKHWISRNVYPDACQSVAIARTLHTSVEYLVTGTESNPWKQELDILKSELEELCERHQ